MQNGSIDEVKQRVQRAWAILDVLHAACEHEDEWQIGEVVALVMRELGEATNTLVDIVRTRDDAESAEAVQDGSEADRLARIAAYRARTGATLDEAKAAVDEAMRVLALCAEAA